MIRWRRVCRWIPIRAFFLRPRCRHRFPSPPAGAGSSDGPAGSIRCRRIRRLRTAKQGHSLLKSWLRPSASDCGAVRTTPCCLRDRLERMVAANRSTFKSSNFAAPFPGGDVRLYWWFRFDGARRSAKRPHAVKCEGGFQCVIDSRDESFSRADAIVVFVGARPERHCLPPRLPQQLWIVEYGESHRYPGCGLRPSCRSSASR